MLTGVPDEMLRLGDGSVCILDYKTARYTDGQDALIGVYRVQLNCYALLSEKVGIGKTTSLGLVYFEPPEPMDERALNASVSPEGFAMPFKATVLPIEVNLGMVAPLLRRAKGLMDMDEPPEGKSGCKDCSTISEIVKACGRLCQA